MRFVKHYTVRWHDTGADQAVTPSRLLEFMQETASLHCRFLGHDLDEMRDKEGRGFVVTRLSMESLSPLHAQDEISVETWVPESCGLFFGRCYEVKRDGAVVARGTTTSALLDLSTRRFLRVSDYDFGFIPEAAVTLSEDLPLRLRLAPSLPLVPVCTREIVCSDLDYNLHMNNTHYPDMLADALPDRTARCVTSVVISYLAEARFGDVLSIACANDSEKDDTFYLRATRPDGTVVTEARIVAPLI
ncbi:MAG: hypothetical protein J6B77_05995 [Clostridia bacterium]|nr:hypothetical protein [Clostridia bacterium]